VQSRVEETLIGAEQRRVFTRRLLFHHIGFSHSEKAILIGKNASFRAFFIGLIRTHCVPKLHKITLESGNKTAIVKGNESATVRNQHERKP
jgi:hypothetical protein